MSRKQELPRGRQLKTPLKLREIECEQGRELIRNHNGKQVSIETSFVTKEQATYILAQDLPGTTLEFFQREQHLSLLIISLANIKQTQVLLDSDWLLQVITSVKMARN